MLTAGVAMGPAELRAAIFSRIAANCALLCALRLAFSIRSAACSLSSPALAGDSRFDSSGGMMANDALTHWGRLQTAQGGSGYPYAGPLLMRRLSSTPKPQGSSDPDCGHPRVRARMQGNQADRMASSRAGEVAGSAGIALVGIPTAMADSDGSKKSPLVATRS
jgi:hypothetical protein